MSLKELPAVIVFPTFSVSTILLVTIVGLCFFKEKLRTLQWGAIFTILISLVLLNI